MLQFLQHVFMELLFAHGWTTLILKSGLYVTTIPVTPGGGCFIWNTPAHCRQVWHAPKTGVCKTEGLESSGRKRNFQYENKKRKTEKQKNNTSSNRIGVGKNAQMETESHVTRNTWHTPRDPPPAHVTTWQCLRPGPSAPKSRNPAEGPNFQTCTDSQKSAHFFQRPVHIRWTLS